jgi:hypothetical protein
MLVLVGGLAVLWICWALVTATFQVVGCVLLDHCPMRDQPAALEVQLPPATVTWEQYRAGPGPGEYDAGLAHQVDLRMRAEAEVRLLQDSLRVTLARCQLR